MGVEVFYKQTFDIKPYSLIDVHVNISETFLVLLSPLSERPFVM